MAITTYLKGPTEILDYAYDFTDILQDGEAIASSSAVAGEGLTVDDVSDDGKIVTAWLSGGISGSIYTVSYTAVTDSDPARTYNRNIKIKIESR